MELLSKDIELRYPTSYLWLYCSIFSVGSQWSFDFNRLTLINSQQRFMISFNVSTSKPSIANQAPCWQPIKLHSLANQAPCWQHTVISYSSLPERADMQWFYMWRVCQRNQSGWTGGACQVHKTVKSTVTHVVYTGKACTWRCQD